MMKLKTLLSGGKNITIIGYKIIKLIKKTMIRKFIMVLLVATCLLSYTTETKAQNYDGTSKYKVQLSPTLIGAVAGGGFIILGALTTADLIWVPDNTSNSRNSHRCTFCA